MVGLARECGSGAHACPDRKNMTECLKIAHDRIGSRLTLGMYTFEIFSAAVLPVCRESGGRSPTRAFMGRVRLG